MHILLRKLTALHDLSEEDDLPPSDGAKGKLGIADLKEGPHAAKEAFG
jgi:hypothetical protein